ncbi:hypothetical protein CEXT_808821, partial [Caerostris extrusa]
SLFSHFFDHNRSRTLSVRRTFGSEQRGNETLMTNPSHFSRKIEDWKPNVRLISSIIRSSCVLYELHAATC